MWTNPPDHHHLPNLSISNSALISLIIFSFLSSFNFFFPVWDIFIIEWMNSRSLKGLFSCDLTSGYICEIVLTCVCLHVSEVIEKKKPGMSCHDPGCHSYPKSCIILIIKRSLKYALSDRRRRTPWWVVIDCCNLKTHTWQSWGRQHYNDLLLGDILWSSPHEGVKDFK